MQTVNTIAVTTAQMQQLEGWMFAAGLPIAALMEKVVQRVVPRLIDLYPLTTHPRVGVWVGSGHNGGDALGVARELHHRGYQVQIIAPVHRFKPLTQAHLNYAQAIGIPILQNTDLEYLQSQWQTLAPQIHWWVDGLFGFGLERPLTGHLAAAIDWLNHHPAPVVSLDLPSGLHSDRGEPLGIAVKATHTLCLGLWKRGLWQETSLPYVGHASCIDLDFPPQALALLASEPPPPQSLSWDGVRQGLSLDLPVNTHKYQRGQVLIIAGSQRYRGAAVLAALGARASGVGMTTIAVPELLVDQVSSRVPEAIVLGCATSDQGGIQRLPEGVNWERFQAIVCGPGLTIAAAQQILPPLLAAVPQTCPILLDADALNALAQDPALFATLQLRSHIITPHAGEFRRLFPDLDTLPPLDRAQAAAQRLGEQAIVVFKGARTAIATGDRLWVNLHSTPALARGGSGDVLAGLMGGLLATGSSQVPPLESVKAAVYWHAFAGCWAADRATPLGVDAFHLANALSPALASQLSPVSPLHASSRHWDL